MRQEEINDLIDKFFLDTLTQEESDRLTEWYRVQNEFDIEWDLQEDEDMFKSRLYAEITSRIKAEKSPVGVSSIWYKVVAAAVVLVILAIGLGIYTKDKQLPPNYVDIKTEKEILPGGEKATLTLSDGTKFTLDGTNDSVLADRHGVTLRKAENGQFSFTFSDPALLASRKGGKHGEVFDIIETPTGGNYKFSLPDGTKVYLNSSSTLKFPVSFSKTERKVLLSGEAYFEVAKHPSKPFIVESGDQTVEVLGTHFNIKSYKNEPAIKTTLLEGRVKVIERSTGDAKYLGPGQEAKLEKSGRFTVAIGDTEQAIGWKNGAFVFNDLQLEDIMRQLERWYDVNVDYSTVPNTRYNGVISRDVPLSKALQMLEVAGGLKFSVAHRTIKINNH
ncbi:FecR family protein [Arcticibacter sp.]|uniref:FecR family protein n=1 Tax=Arcticibacter sp. TaxID=1872630 RepID=UPI00389046AA